MAGLLRSRVVVAVLAALLGMTVMLVVDAGARDSRDHDNHDGFVYSGCFHRGKITKVRIRDVKPERCETIETDSQFGHARYVTWSSTGPLGDTGPTGPQGIQGPAGADGDAHFTPFYVTLDAPDGDSVDVTVFTYETITVLARCYDNVGGDDVLDMIVTSSEDGWFSNQNSTLPAPAGAEVIGGSETEPDGTDKFDNDIDDFIVGTPAGHILGWDGESTGFGLNVFGHDCVLAGNIWTTTGTP
jgi:hypothetical protein